MPKYCIEIADIQYRNVIVDAPNEAACDEWWDRYSVEKDREFRKRFPNKGNALIDHVETFEVSKGNVNIQINKNGEEI